MQVVIDIPEEQYEYLSKIANAGQEPLGYFERVIMRGIPLPKGHGWLVDISEYEDNYFNVAIKYDDGDHTHEKYTFVLPTIIEAEKEGDEHGNSN